MNAKTITSDELFSRLNKPDFKEHLECKVAVLGNHQGEDKIDHAELRSIDGQDSIILFLDVGKSTAAACRTTTGNELISFLRSQPSKPVYCGVLIDDDPSTFRSISDVAVRSFVDFDNNSHCTIMFVPTSI
jgi:hypothetical protein